MTANTPARPPRPPLLSTILVAGVLIRLVWIWQPYVDTCAWRESDVAMVARNLAQDWDILHPRIDWAGTHPGYVGTEFPLIPLIAAVLYKALGVHDWIGRIISIPFFVLGAAYLHAFARRVYDERIAWAAAAIFSFVPISVVVGRAFMSDMAAVALSIAGLELFARWAKNPVQRRPLIESALLTALAILVKAPAIIVGLPMAVLAFRTLGSGVFRSASLWLFGSVCLLPPALWYAHAWKVATTNYPFHMFGEGGFQVMSPAFYARVVGAAVILALTPPAFVLMCKGFRSAVQPEYAGVMRAWAAGFAIFFLLAGAGNRHVWYYLMLVPPMACLAAAGFVRLSSGWRKAATTCLVLFATAGVAAMFYPYGRLQRQTGLALRSVSSDGDLVVIADSGDPTVLNYSGRKGWHFPEQHGVQTGNPASDKEAIEDLEALRRQGARFLAFIPDTAWYTEYYKDFSRHLNRCYRRVPVPGETIFDLRADRCAESGKEGK
jgi:4-amino-4-deoxy-L-arabinose transferase-like glycosyltransferase